MAAITPPIWIAAGGELPEPARRATAAIFGGRGGIVAPGDLAVSQNGTPNMSVNVATGQVLIPGTQGTYQGLYACDNQGVLNLAIAAADPTNGRRDLVVARVRDAQYSGATSSFAIEVVTGTPSASPVDPTTPANSWVLARVLVDAGATSITAGKLTDLRTVQTGQFGRAAALGGIIPTTSSFRPGHVVGLAVYESDTKRLAISDGTDWQPPGALGRLGSATRNTNFSISTTIGYALSVTVATLPNRRLRVRAHTNVNLNSGGTTASVGIANGVGTILNQAYTYHPAGGVNQQVSVEHELNSGAGGSMTFQLSAFTGSGTGTLAAAASAYTLLAVLDEGPA